MAAFSGTLAPAKWASEVDESLFPATRNLQFCYVDFRLGSPSPGGLHRAFSEVRTQGEIPKVVHGGVARRMEGQAVILVENEGCAACLSRSQGPIYELTRSAFIFLISQLAPAAVSQELNHFGSSVPAR